MRNALPLLLLLALSAACSRQGSPEEAATTPAAERSAAPAAASSAAAQPVEGAMRSFGAWEATCDNTRSCTLFGFRSADADGGMPPIDGWGVARVERAGGADAAPLVRLMAGQSNGSGPRRMEASVDGGRAFQVQASGESGSGYAGELRGAEAAALVAALRNGRVLRIAVEGQEAGAVSLDGAAAALLWADERQGRTEGGTPGAAPAPAVQAARPLGGEVKAPAAVQRLRTEGDCALEQGEGAPGVVGTRLLPDLVLWQAPCGSGAYNFTTAFYLGDASGGALRPLPLERHGEEGPAHHLVNANLDGGRLEAFSKGRGVGDCGSERAWVWDGRAFVLVEERVMGRCEGVSSDQWPALHRAVVR